MHLTNRKHNATFKLLNNKQKHNSSSFADHTKFYVRYSSRLHGYTKYYTVQI